MKKEDGDGDDDMDSDGSEKEEKTPEWTVKAQAIHKRLKHKYPALSRPLIFVCNEGFARALFPLKDIVLKLKVPNIGKDRLNERLVEILRLESIRDFSNSVRQNIIESSMGDARSAITRI